RRSPLLAEENRLCPRSFQSSLGPAKGRLPSPFPHAHLGLARGRVREAPRGRHSHALLIEQPVSLSTTEPLQALTDSHIVTKSQHGERGSPLAAHFGSLRCGRPTPP